MLSVAEVIEQLEIIAPPSYTEEGDRVGLQIGSRGKQVAKVVVSVDASPPVVELAIERKADLLVAHHPLIHTPLDSVTDEDPVSRSVASLVRADTALYVLHTNFDIAPGGASDVLAKLLGIADPAVLSARQTDALFKICVFVPEEAVERVRDAMAEAGAGRIGEYAHCSFRTQGVGSFVPLPAARPCIGTAGKLEEVAEFRLEMVCAGSRLNPVTEAMLASHPYEEAAYDVYQLVNEPPARGLGRVGNLDRPISLGEFAERAKSALGLDHVKVSGEHSMTVKRAAVCGGGGSSLCQDAIRAGADVYVTGDTRYHDVLCANARGLAVIDAGHFETERPALAALADRLREALGAPDVSVEFIQ